MSQPSTVWAMNLTVGRYEETALEGCESEIGQAEREGRGDQSRSSTIACQRRLLKSNNKKLGVGMRV